MKINKFSDYHIKKSPTKVICLIHGIFASHTDFDDLLEILMQLDFSIYAVKLPPYTDKAVDYHNLGTQEWNKKVYSVLDQLLEQYQEVSVISHSLGSLLVMQYQKINSLQNVVFWAPALIPKMTLTSTKVGLGLGKTPYLQKCKELSSVNAKGLLNKARLIKPTLSIFRQSKVAKQQLSNITIPCMVVLSRKDESVSMKSASLVMDNIRSDKKQQVTLNHSYHNVISTEERHVYDQIIEFIQKD